MSWAKLVSALKLSEDEVLLPVSIIQPATFILAKRFTDQSIENRLHGISFGYLGQPLIPVIDETPPVSFFKFTRVLPQSLILLLQQIILPGFSWRFDDSGR